MWYWEMSEHVLLRGWLVDCSLFTRKQVSGISEDEDSKQTGLLSQTTEEDNEKDSEEKPALTGNQAWWVLGETTSILGETVASGSMSAKLLPSLH